MKLHTLKPNKGAKHRRKRLGAGQSSGLGKTSGKGNKGQKARAGRKTIPGFEGGQMPLYRRLPKRGFNNARFKTTVAVVNVSQLEKLFEADETVNEASLRAKGLVNRKVEQIKILGNGDLSKKLTVEGCTTSASAKEKIEKAGGAIK